MTSMNEFATVSAFHLDDVSGGIGWAPGVPGRAHPSAGCHFNWGEVGSWTAGGVIAGARGGPWGAVLGGIGGGLADIGSQIANGACSAPKHKK